ncbi:glycoside hydrolase family 3 C-terminal domain-containing protein [Telluria mixta]|uniref:Glycoside hydrolase family 3 C-terminal domain-containing protein n=1 Tax=Telluria mixta TaxID=34071 RepID=A0ABT2BY84_9BURK|nr:glycoside hydrolase family 3 C-terminal domain-containing protein [Telluria mixta]MCS0630090.1 glycoside hydrolase family 3 C-terminal domain-containing protein [Telluria mixta]WEM94597.1 glycoside hydrolase family 3 C-terminal domain-containing protein [Telluria mixta]
MQTNILRAIALGAALCAGGAHAATYPFQDPNLAPQQRIANILALMTPDEKIDALSTDSGVPRLGIPSFGGTEGIHGVVQRGESKRQRQPIPTTQFPQPPGMGASWDPELVRQAGAVQSTEARYITQSAQYRHPMLMQWGPQSDLARDPRWGRSEEVYGEDAFLVGTMATAFTRGIQGDDPKYWRGAALLKHFLANSNENGRGNSTSDFDDRQFHEYYAAPFRMAFEEGGARALMASYNAWNGTPMGVHPVLRSLVIGKWDADVVSSDGGAIGNLVKLYKRYPDQKAAAVAGLKAGINQYLDKYQDELRAALKEGTITVADLDDAVARKLRTTIKLGLIDPPAGNPYAAIKDGPAPWDSAAHKAVSLKMALESIVLMKNDGRALPLAKTGVKRIAVIGPHADSVHWDWYGGIAPYTVTALAGIKAAVGPDVKVNYAADNANDAAVKAARDADVAIVVVGNDPTCGPNMAHDWTDAGTKPCADPGDGREGRDRETLALAQEGLVKQVLAANPRTVMVLVSSFPYTINWAKEHVPAIVQMAHSSQDQGTALAQVLFGDYNPGGKLVATWPATEAQLPPMMDYDIRHGRTYMYFKGQPLFPFGHGLSYTTFRYGKLRTSAPALAANGTVDVDVDVTNTGKVAGDSVVELYAAWPKSQAERPRQALVGFQRVNLKPGETRTVRIPLAARRLAYWNTQAGRFDVEAVPVKLMVGESSADIRLTTTLPVKR